MSENIDRFLYSLPFIGIVFRRNYSYFKRNTTITNVVHIVAGVGIGFILAGGDLFSLELIAFSIAIVGHVYAFIKG